MDAISLTITEIVGESTGAWVSFSGKPKSGFVQALRLVLLGHLHGDTHGHIIEGIISESFYHKVTVH